MIVIPTTADRIGRLESLAASFVDWHEAGRWPVAIVGQGHEGDELDRLRAVAGRMDAVLFWRSARLGPHAARRVALDILHAETWVAIDDDVTLLPETTYVEASTIAARPGVGLVSCGWANGRGVLAHRPLDGALVRQPIVYTGGGFVLGRAAQAAIRALPLAPYWSESVAWSLACYLRGLCNYRYRGSVALALACAVGGRTAWVREHETVLPDERYVVIRKAVGAGHDWHIPTTTDLTDEAHRLHHEARRAAGW